MVTASAVVVVVAAAATATIAMASLIRLGLLKLLLRCLLPHLCDCRRCFLIAPRLPFVFAQIDHVSKHETDPCSQRLRLLHVRDPLEICVHEGLVFSAVELLADHGQQL